MSNEYHLPQNTTNDGCAFSIRHNYQCHAYLNGMTRGRPLSCNRLVGSDRIRTIGRLNSSQDGIVLDPSGIADCHTSGHGNCPKILLINEEPVHPSS